MRVSQLLEISYLELEVYAGYEGLEREIAWTQVSELPDPTEWLASGGLVMSTGLGLPHEPEEQRAYVERLDAAGMSGLVVGERPREQVNAPVFSAALAAAADERGFPVITMPYEHPFSGVAQVVAQATHSAEHARLVQSLQIYDSVRLVTGSVSGTEFVERLARVLGCELHVLDPSDGAPLFKGHSSLEPEIVDEVMQRFSRGSVAASALRRLTGAPRPSVALRLSASVEAVLVASASADGLEEPDLFVLRHVAAIVAWEVEKGQAERERRRRLGAGLLADLLDNRIEGRSAARMLEQWNLREDSLVLAAAPYEEPGDYLANGSLADERSASEGELASLQSRLERCGLESLMSRRMDYLVILLDSSDESIRALREELGCVVGVSDPLVRLARSGDAAREARWALQEARATGKEIVRYGDNMSSHFLPRTLSESRAAIRHVLGPIIDYDRENGSQLVTSLWTYLSNNRSLDKTASELYVHRQTVVYRMHRVEQLTGRRLGSMEEMANFWLAMKAMREMDDHSDL